MDMNVIDVLLWIFKLKRNEEDYKVVKAIVSYEDESAHKNPMIIMLDEGFGDKYARAVGQDERLARHHDVHISIISGRSVQSVKKMVGIEGKE